MNSESYSDVPFHTYAKPLQFYTARAQLGVLVAKKLRGDLLMTVVGLYAISDLELYTCTANERGSKSTPLADMKMASV